MCATSLLVPIPATDCSPSPEVTLRSKRIVVSQVVPKSLVVPVKSK